MLTFLGGLKSNTYSLYLTDIAHHHLALGLILIWASHLYNSLVKALSHKIRHVLFVFANANISNSLHLQLSFALALLGILTSLVAYQGSYPYVYLSYDFIPTLSLHLHHQYIGSLLILGSFAHASIFLIRDLVLDTHDLSLFLIRANKGALISHLTWICLFLGFHTLGLYLHNDTIVAFASIEKQILIEPIFAQVFQDLLGFAFYGYSIKTSSWIQLQWHSSFIPIGPADLLNSHAFSLGLHISILICIKGCLDARGSKLMPDKINFGYGFACDGPGRGGTCDISAWDSFYLATFWMLNTVAWITFNFHWKHLTLWQNAGFQFEESSTYLNGWFRDYLWFNSAPLINGYSSYGGNDNSVWAWVFLLAHLCWATGFMFLISWRGYWQELIDSILTMHLKTPVLYNLWNGDTCSFIHCSSQVYFLLALS